MVIDIKFRIPTSIILNISLTANHSLGTCKNAESTATGSPLFPVQSKI
jgi:hypothetical protein